MGKRSKDKGDRGEREAAEFLKKYGFDANRGLGQARGGHEIPDVECEELAYWIEVKRGRHNPVTGYYQAKGYVEKQGDDREPLVMSRRDHCDWLVTVSAEVFFELVAGKTGGVSMSHVEVLP